MPTPGPPSKPIPSVHILQHRDNSTTVVLGVYEDLQDANDECLRHAGEAGVTLLNGGNSSTGTGPDAEHLTPVEPLRWDTADGVSCWVEEFRVTPKRILEAGRGNGKET